jgi:aryl-alcohol dehydrogenase-like predicted oxidoreductase
VTFFPGAPAGRNLHFASYVLYNLQMARNRFGKTGLNVSPLGFGAAEIGFLKTEHALAGHVMNMLLDAGANIIDTAASYETSEEIIGKSIGHRRSQYILISKCGQKLGGLDGEAWSPGLIAQTIERSLSRLKTDVLDVMLLHTCDEQVLKKGEALGALVKARQEGKLRFVGYSGDNHAAAYAATLPDVAVIETSISIADQANIDIVLPAARKHDVAVLVKRSIANAAWKRTEQQPGFYGGYAQPYADRLAKMKLDPASLGITGPRDLAWPELALRFTLSQMGVNSAIIGTTNPDNIRRNIEIANKGPLPEQTVQKIRTAFTAARGNDNWPGLQ